MRVSLLLSIMLKLTISVTTVLLDLNSFVAVPMVLPISWMESPLTFCTVTVAIADLAKTKIAQGYTLALYHCHKDMGNNKSEIPLMTACLENFPDPHTYTGDAYDTSIPSKPTTNTTSHQYSPSQSTGMGDASTSFAPILLQFPEEEVLLHTTTQSVNCPGIAPVS